MIPYTDTDLPIEIKYDMELMKLIIKAKELYGKYNAIILFQDIDPSLVLKPFILQESYKSCELGGNKIDQSSLYYLRYNQLTDDIRDIFNYNDVLLNIEKFISPNFKLSMTYLNKIHKNINDSIKGNLRTPGKLRNKLSWIGKRGSTIHNADFVPVPPREIPVAMANFIRHFNKTYSIDKLVEIAVSHAQFENIHPYSDANGRLGRLLVPIHALLDSKTHISLFISEVIKENEYMYYQKLQDTRKGKWESYIKFFIDMIILQLERNIRKLEEINVIYKKDMEKVLSLINKKNGINVYHYMFSNITFTLHEMSSDLLIDYQTIRNYVNKLFGKGIVAKHKVSKGEYVYTYINMYSIHVPIEWL